ncbi:hypothetical protein D3C76_1296500 [compost metagenome]
MNALSPHFFDDCCQGGILRGQRHLNVELQIPFGIAETFFFARLILNFHQFHYVLLGHLGRSKLSDIAFYQLTRLEQFKRTIAGKFQTFVRHRRVFWKIGNHMNA